MAVDVAPPELARLIDFAERPRDGDWSLRSALVRYAQPNPDRVNRLLDLVRRIEWALQPHAKLLEREGEDVWRALTSGERPTTEPHDFVVDLLSATADLDRLGDALASWAVDPAGPAPDAEIDSVSASLARRLDDLGVPREERQARPRRRGV